MGKFPGWQQWEADLQELLGLDATICSGNQWQDIGDATDNTHPRFSWFRPLVDCKYSEKGSWSLNRKVAAQWLLRGTETGRRAMFAVRLWPRGFPSPLDMVVLHADDFAELLEKARENV